MRDLAETIRRLEAKACDRATPAPERAALLDKAEQLRVRLAADPKATVSDDELQWVTVDWDEFESIVTDAWRDARLARDRRGRFSEATPVSDLFRRR